MTERIDVNQLVTSSSRTPYLLGQVLQRLIAFVSVCHVCISAAFMTENGVFTLLLLVRSTLAAAALLIAFSAPVAMKAVTLDQACQKFSSKLTEAQASGDKQKAQSVYTQGSQRIAKKFNGATCPNVKAPTP